MFLIKVLLFWSKFYIHFLIKIRHGISDQRSTILIKVLHRFSDQNSTSFLIKIHSLAITIKYFPLATKKCCILAFDARGHGYLATTNFNFVERCYTHNFQANFWSNQRTGMIMTSIQIFLGWDLCKRSYSCSSDCLVLRLCQLLSSIYD